MYYVVRSSAPAQTMALGGAGAVARRPAPQQRALGQELRRMAGSGVPTVALRAAAERFERLAALDRAAEAEAGTARPVPVNRLSCRAF